MQYGDLNAMTSTDFKYFTGHSKAASLSNSNKAGWHIEMWFGHQKYSTIIYKC